MRFRAAASILVLIPILTFSSSPSTTGAHAAVPGLVPRCDISAPTISRYGFREVRGFAKHAKLWALLFYRPAAPADTDLKIALRMTGSGPLRVRAIGPTGRQLRPIWIEVHSGSNWNRPGDEWGTGWRLPTAGCWHLHATRTHLAGDVWLTVVPKT